MPPDHPSLCLAPTDCYLDIHISTSRPQSPSPHDGTGSKISSSPPKSAPGGWPGLSTSHKKGRVWLLGGGVGDIRKSADRPDLRANLAV